MLASVFGQTLTHLHRKDADDVDGDDPETKFWRRHHRLDDVLLKTLQYLPDQLQLRSGIHTPMVVQLHINIHASTICLHQAAVFKVGDRPRIEAVRAEAKARCLTATESMLTIMRLVDTSVIERVSFTNARIPV